MCSFALPGAPYPRLLAYPERSAQAGCINLGGSESWLWVVRTKVPVLPNLIFPRGLGVLCAVGGYAK